MMSGAGGRSLGWCALAGGRDVGATLDEGAPQHELVPLLAELLLCPGAGVWADFVAPALLPLDRPMLVAVGMLPVRRRAGHSRLADPHSDEGLHDHGVLDA